MCPLAVGNKRYRTLIDELNHAMDKVERESEQGFNELAESVGTRTWRPDVQRYIN